MPRDPIAFIDDSESLDIDVVHLDSVANDDQRTRCCWQKHTLDDDLSSLNMKVSKQTSAPNSVPSVK